MKLPVTEDDLESPSLNIEEYFAVQPKDEVGALLVERVKEYEDFCQTFGLTDMWRKSYNAYYSGQQRNGQMNRGGELGEYVISGPNHYFNILQHIHTLTTQQQFSWQPQAANNDYKSRSQSIGANLLLEWVRKTKNVRAVADRAAEYALWATEGFVFIGWNATGGQEIKQAEVAAPLEGVEQGKPKKKFTGDYEFEAYHPYDVIRDYALDNNDKSNWIILRSYRNKWDLAAKYPEKAHEILSAEVSDRDDKRFDRSSAFSKHRQKRGSGDVVPFYRFFHKPTEALPQGRYVEFVSADVVLIESVLPYPEITVGRIAPGELSGTIFGFSAAYNLLPLQEGVDTLYSIAMTNQITHGVSNIWVPEGSNLSVEQISKGLNILEGGKQAPEAVNFTGTPKEIFDFLKDNISQMEVISGVNAVARGNVPVNGKMSGAAMALLQTMAIQYSIKYQQSWVQLNEFLGTMVVKLAQTYAKEPIVASIIGKTNRAITKQFTGEDLDQIQRVFVTVGNPLAQTQSGRLEIARDLKEMGYDIDPQDYLSIIDTGRYEPIVDRARSQTLLIAEENERLQNGEEVIAMVGDAHAKHIQDHSIVEDSPDLRQAMLSGDPEAQTIMKNVAAHKQQHLDMLRKTDPQMLMILGQQSLAPAPSAPPQAGPSPLAPSGPAPIQPSTPPAKGPKNPLTGENAPIVPAPAA